MYSLVLMAAVSGGPDVAGADAPAMMVPATVSYGCSGVSAYSGGYGCGSSVSYSCYGSGYGCGSSVAMPAYRYGCGSMAYSSGCYGSCSGSVAHSGCSGCYGSSCHGAAAPAKHGFLGIMDRMHARRAASAGAGCMGSSCHGTVAYSGCYGSSCHGSMAYSGGCYGSAAYSTGCIGVSYGTATYSGAIYGAAVSPSGTGIISERVIGEKVISPSTGAAGAATTDKKPAVDPKGTDAKEKGTDAKDKKTGGEEGANIKFQLPANAKLYVDGRLTSGEGTERAFFTPPLPVGQKFFYDVKAEVVVEGKTITEEKRVIVQAGAELKETFPKLLAAAGNPANVASK